MYSDDEIYIGDNNVYNEEVDEEFDDYNFDQADHVQEPVFSNDKCFAPDVELADLDYLTIHDLNKNEFKELNALSNEGKLDLKSHEFEDSLKFYNMKVVEIPQDMNKKLLSDNWDEKFVKYEFEGASKENVIVMTENDFIEFENKIREKYWSFEEDFKIMMCAFFYDDPTFAFDVINRSNDEVLGRYEILKNSERFKFLEKTFSLWPNEYLKLLKSIPLHDNDIEIIRSMPSNRLLSNKEMRELKRNLLLPMDKEMIMYYWKLYHDKNLLFDQLEERTKSYRPTNYIMDDVESREDVDFTRTHRYLYNAIPGELPGFKNIFSSKLLKSLVASDPIVTLDFVNTLDEYAMWKPRVLVSYSSKFEIIPLMLKDKIYYPTRPYNIAVLIFRKNLELFLLNLCYYPITVDLKFVQPRHYIKISTDSWTSVCLMPIQADQLEFIIKPNFHYFLTGISPKLLPKFDRIKFSFSKHNVLHTADNKVPYKESKRIRRYRGLLKRTRTDNSLKLAEDDIEFIQDFQTNHLINRDRILRKEKKPIDSEIIADLLNDIVENVDITLKGGVWRKDKIAQGSFPMKSKIFYSDKIPEKNVKGFDKFRLELFSSIKPRNYVMKTFTGCHTVDFMYSSLLARRKDKNKIKIEAKKMNDKFKFRESRTGPVNKPPVLKTTPALRKLPVYTKIIPLKAKKKTSDDNAE